MMESFIKFQSVTKITNYLLIEFIFKQGGEHVGKVGMVGVTVGNGRLQLNVYTVLGEVELIVLLEPESSKVVLM